MLRTWVSAVALVALAAVPAAAESPRSVMLELHGGAYTPDVDAQFSGGSPYADIFGDSSMLMFGMHIDYQLWQDFGTIAIGAGARYGWVDGTALTTTGAASTDEAGLNIFPFTASLTYRFDWLQNEFGIPLVPYGKAGITYAIWWTTDGKNETSSTGGQDGSGGTWGWHGGGGIQLLLDFIMPGMARDFDNEVGVNNSYIFAEVLVHQINDFGSGSSINLGATAFSFGLMFEI